MAAEVIDVIFVDEFGKEIIVQESDPKKKKKRKLTWGDILGGLGILEGLFLIIVSLGSTGPGGGFRVKNIEIKEVSPQKTQF